MSRPAKQSNTLYLGLFVIFFALFAREHQRLLRLKGDAEPLARTVVPAEPVHAAPSQKIAELSERLRNDSLFQIRADGLTALYGPDFVTVSFYGDDVYQEGAFAFREEWFTSLDRLATLVQPFLEKGLRIEIIGYTDQGSAKERKPTDYGDSDFALSFARAEWVARFLERRSLIQLKDRVKLTGAGAVKAGRKVELKFTFSSN